MALTVKLPSASEWLNKSLVCVVAADPADFDDIVVPWLVDAEYSEYLVHVSSIPVLQAAKQLAGYADSAARDWVAERLHESKMSLSNRTKTTLGYDWRQHFTPAWTYREYQAAGMERVYERWRLGMGGALLGDDVGLGKTLQAIGLIARLHSENVVRRSSPAIVFTTTSTKSQWADEIAKFSRVKLDIVVVAGTISERLRRLAHTAHVKILNYEMARLKQYAGSVRQACHDASVAVFDETYKVKNVDSATFKAVEEVTRPIPRRLAFNATPVENHLHDLYSQIRLCDRNVLGSFNHFSDRYLVRNYEGRIVRCTNVREFRLRTLGVHFRRTRDECGVEMPDVVSEVRPVELSRKQLAAYNAACGKFISDTATGAVGLARLAAVEYAAFAADIEDTRSDSAKLDDLISVLDGELSGERLVVFSKYRRIVEFAAARLARFHPMLLTGKTSAKERDAMRRRFESEHGAGRVLLCTEAGDRGLNLQAAGVVVNLDLPWTSGKLRQRVGRCARIGQRRKSVLVLNMRATLPNAKSTDDFFASVIHRKRDIHIRLYGDDGVDEIGEQKASLGAIREYLRTAGGLSDKPSRSLVAVAR